MIAEFSIELGEVTWDIHVTSYKLIKPWGGNPLDCPSDTDYYGDIIFEFDAFSDEESVYSAHNKWSELWINETRRKYEALRDEAFVEPPDL